MVLLSILFFLLMVAGMPIAFGIGIAGFSFFATSPFIPISIGVQQVAAMSQSFPLLAVPLFVLAGHMMNKTGITERLIDCSNVLVAWMSGGLAQVCILLSTFMGGVSGSAVADAAMEARVLGPSMIQSGYSKGFTGASIAVGSLITATIPPSLGLILYGFVGNVSIGRLFLAGVVPGILMMIAMMVTVWLVARKRGYGSVGAQKPTLPRVGRAVWHAKWALIFPVALLVAIRSGVFTPSEVGAFAVVYAVAIGAFVHRDLTWASFNEALSESVIDIGVIALIILLSGMVGYAIVFEQAPQTIAQLMLGLSSQPLVVILMILIFIFVCGLFVEATVLTLLLTPIFVPIITHLGVDPVHFGVLMMSIITLGGMTPPVGVAMYAVCSILDCPVEEYLKESIPFLIAILLVITALALLPGVVLFLPNLLM
ncbi:TRAP transporter large permease [Consotaella aegiceratis]|uniref:TRAP transporter large permease n=1 Tax=Consotaella aegiceratis TaxID=3097961 RepID=UPI002F3ECAB6